MYLIIDLLFKVQIKIFWKTKKKFRVEKFSLKIFIQIFCSIFTDKTIKVHNRTRLQNKTYIYINQKQTKIKLLLQNKWIHFPTHIYKIDNILHKVWTLTHKTKTNKKKNKYRTHVNDFDTINIPQFRFRCHILLLLLF